MSEAGGPSVDVVIPTRSRPALLAEAIASVWACVAAAPLPLRVGVIVIDDSPESDEATRAANQQAAIDGRATYLRNRGSGVCAARNTGIFHSSATYTAFVDDDDVWLPDHLTDHLRILESQPGVAMVHAQGVLTDAELRPVFPPSPPSPLPSGEIFEYVLRQCLSFGTIVVRREALIAVGAFDEGIRTSEDWDLLLRLTARYRVVGIDRPVALYRQAAANFKRSAEWQAQFADARKVLGRAPRLVPGRRTPFHERWTVLIPIRGWFAARFMFAAQDLIGTGEYREAWRCLVAGVRVSPVHAALSMRGGYARTIGRLLVSAAQSRVRSGRRRDREVAAAPAATGPLAPPVNPPSMRPSDASNDG